MTESMLTAIKIIVFWNIITLLIMGTDKLCAMRGWRRIPEDVLLVTAFAMGGLGSLLGMWLFSHKTLKLKFKILMPLALIFNISLVFLLWYFKVPSSFW